MTSSASSGAGDPASHVTLRCWGTRGSIPDPGPDTVRYGGNTSCVEIRAGDESLILDAGTGLRRLGKEILRRGGGREVRIFLSHYHWDHIQGLPFFGPAYKSDFTLRVHGPDQDGKTAGDIVAGQACPPYFPVTLQDFPGSFAFSPVEEGGQTQGSFRIRAMRMRHPSFTLGYRVEAFGRSIVYVPDNELEGGHYEVPTHWREAFEEFVEGADVLLHDAMFTENERSAFVGWGHSTYEQAVQLALRSEVKSLFFFHHAPGRTDDEIDSLLERFRAEVDGLGGDLGVHAAAEGADLSLSPIPCR